MVDEQKETVEKEEPKRADVNPSDGVQSETTKFIQKLEEMKALDKSLGDKLREIREFQASVAMGGTAGLHIESRKTDEQVKAEKAQKLADEITHAFK